VVQLKSLIDNWILIAQGLLASVGALAFLVAFMYKIVAVDPASVPRPRSGSAESSSAPSVSRLRAR